MRHRCVFLLLSLLAIGCNHRPSRADALAAFHRAKPGVDSSPAIIRVWADGPPWFSCAEVLAKLKGDADRRVVRDQLGAWRTLVVADWVTLRDTADGRVVEPGWCAATLHNEQQRIASGWKPVRGDSMPNGGERRGWEVTVGTRRVEVPMRATVVGRDSARTIYRFTVVPNENGVAAGANSDTVQRRALLARVDGQWRLVRMDDMQ